MSEKTPLYSQHQQQGASLVDFAGWQMPIHYGSLIAEHHHVRQDAGMFDVSHMTVIDVEGSDAQRFLRYLLANDVVKLALNQALYSCMLNHDAGILDDLIVYYLAQNYYRVVVNAATRESDLAWMQQVAADFKVTLRERRDLAMVAIQGPEAIAKVTAVLTASQQQAITGLKPFFAAACDEWLIARTGYTGEDGFEVILPAQDAVTFWQALCDVGVAPCGLGARDTLRLEAGMNLYGHDMDDSVNPLQSGLGWTVAWEPSERDFIGRKALTDIRAAGVSLRLVGLILHDKGVLREGQTVQLDDGSTGVITSGTFSPTLKKSIALARVPRGIGTQCKVLIRNKSLTADVVKPPFVRHGKAIFKSYP